MSMTDPHSLRMQAQSIEREQGAAAALQWVDSELAKGTPSADLWNLAGNVAMRSGDFIAAAARFGNAAKTQPSALEHSINQAIALTSAGDSRGALAVLELHKDAGKSDPRYGSVRANAARNAGHLADAAHWYDNTLRLDPRHKKALNGRARVALERAENDALQRFDHAITIDSGNADLWLGKAQALDVNGDAEGARAIAQQLVEQAPAWGEGLKFLAQLRLGADEEDFTSHYGDAANKVPQDPNILNDWITQLAGLDFATEAAEVAGRARKAFPDQPYFALQEAIHTGAAGNDERAETIFAALDFNGHDRTLHEARHRIRRHEFDRAEALLGTTLEEHPSSVSAWALLGIVWRCTKNPKADWLHEQAGLYRKIELHDAESVLPPAIALLHELHDNSPLPLGQSLRGGTQTRGILFHRMEPELAALKSAILQTVEEFQAKWPATDPDHPLLRFAKTKLGLAGSWSVRLSGGGDFHTSHIHPLGIISSALYLEKPDTTADIDPTAGWLEIGCPPPDLRLDLEPLAMIEPQPGHLALFPSTLYHGTRPFPNGRRMTVAFDVMNSE